MERRRNTCLCWIHGEASLPIQIFMSDHCSERYCESICFELCNSPQTPLHKPRHRSRKIQIRGLDCTPESEAVKIERPIVWIFRSSGRNTSGDKDLTGSLYQMLFVQILCLKYLCTLLLCWTKDSSKTQNPLKLREETKLASVAVMEVSRFQFLTESQIQIWYESLLQKM